MRRYILYIFALLTCLGCIDENLSSPERKGEIHLSSSSARVITKADFDYIPFNEGTKYILYGVQQADPYDWTESATKMYNVVGTEKSGEIDYGEKIPYDLADNVDFYGITYGTEDIPVPTSETGAPLISVQEDPAFPTMPDLMYSNNLKGCNGTSGITEMLFRHAMSKLSFEVTRADDESLEGIEIQKIEIVGGLYSNGVFNPLPENGSWTEKSVPYTEENPAVFYGGSPADAAIPVTTDVTVIPDSSDPSSFREMLIIPNGGENVKVRVTYTHAGVQKVITYDLMTAYEDDSGNVQSTVFEFLPNYSYRLTIMMMHNTVQVLAISPKIHDWIDVDLKDGEEVMLGTPVTFGDVMWMDRNLGAKSADAKNDFYNSIGFYYQFGRNIPYILDIEKWVEYVDDDNEKPLWQQDTNERGYPVMYDKTLPRTEDQMSKTDYQFYLYWCAYNDPLFWERPDGDTFIAWESLTEEQKEFERNLSKECLYTFDHLGNKVFGVRPPGEVHARYPGEVVDPADDNNSSNAYRFGANIVSATSTWAMNQNDPEIRSYWEDVKDHPCPKGWRLPTRYDLYAFMPRGYEIDWNSVAWSDAPTKKTREDILAQTGEANNRARSGYIEYTDAANTYTEDARFGIVTEEGVQYNVIYILKNKGTENAYRIRIISRFSKSWDKVAGKHTDEDSKNKRYVEISRYPATSTSSITDYVHTGNVEGSIGKDDWKTQWDNPSETMSFPAAGFIVTDNYIPDLRSFGFGSVLRTSEPSEGKPVSNWVLYLSVTDFQVSVQNGSRQSLGDQVRCVRDVNAE